MCEHLRSIDMEKHDFTTKKIIMLADFAKPLTLEITHNFLIYFLFVVNKTDIGKKEA